MDKMISISEAGKVLGVTTRTLKRWEETGKLKVYRTLGNHRRYKLSEVEALFGLNEKEELESNEEMVKDLISIVTCFSARLYGARGGRKLKKVLKELETERKAEKNESYNKSNAN